jgi:hypothetical protein
MNTGSSCAVAAATGAGSGVAQEQVRNITAGTSMDLAVMNCAYATKPSFSNGF